MAVSPRAHRRTPNGIAGSPELGRLGVTCPRNLAHGTPCTGSSAPAQWLGYGIRCSKLSPRAVARPGAPLGPLVDSSAGDRPLRGALPRGRHHLVCPCAHADGRRGVQPARLCAATLRPVPPVPGCRPRPSPRHPAADPADRQRRHAARFLERGRRLSRPAPRAAGRADRAARAADRRASAIDGFGAVRPRVRRGAWPVIGEHRRATHEMGPGIRPKVAGQAHPVSSARHRADHRRAGGHA